MAIDDVVDVIPVGDRFMPAAGAVDVVFVVAGAAVGRRTGVGIRVGHVESMFVHVVSVHVMQVTVVKVVNVIAVSNRCMSAIRSMNVRVVGVFVAGF